MGRMEPRYSKDQRVAIVTAIVDEGMDPKVAVDLAAKGELHDLESFEFNLNTAKSYAGEERRRRRGHEIQAVRQNGRPEERLDALTAQSLAILEANISRIERAALQGKMSMRDVQLLREMVKCARELRGLARGIPPTSSGDRNKKNAAKAQRPGETPPDQPRQDDPPSALVAEMQQRIEQEERQAKANATANGKAGPSARA